jgi:hypothetical protein
VARKASIWRRLRWAPVIYVFSTYTAQQIVFESIYGLL